MRLTKYYVNGIVMTENVWLHDVLQKLADYEDAEEQGRLVMLDRETALAIAAGCRAIRTTKRFHDASYVYDPFGENGGPYEIPYAKAEEILCNIWDNYSLDKKEAEAVISISKEVNNDL